MSHRWMYRNAGCMRDIAITEPGIFKKGGLFAKASLKIVTILGSARKGKSTLLNRLIELDVFKTSDDIAGCTQGVHIYEVHETTDDSVVMYADTEGQLGNDTNENDVKLFASVVFLSKVIIFNVMSSISAQELLEKLKVFILISEHLNLNVCGEFKLGHLIIALRDYSLTATEEDVRDRFFGKEDDSEKPGAKERNKIRENLHLLFESLEVFIFRKPITEMTTNSNSRVNEFKTKIHGKLGEPRKFGERTCLTPGNVGEFAKAVVNQMNDPKEYFDAKTVVKLEQRNELNQMCEQYKACLLKLLYEVCLPVDHFDKELPTRKMNELIEQFKKVASKADFACGSEIGEKLETFFQQRLADTRRDNESILKAISKVKRTFENELKQRFCRLPLPDKPEKIDKALDQEKQRAFEMFEKIEDDPCKELVSEELTEFANEEKKKMMKENDDRIYARKKIDKAKHAFKESMGKEVANLQFPKMAADGVEECLEREILSPLLKTFDKDTEDIDLAEYDYKKQVRSKLEDGANERISDILERNERTKSKANEISCAKAVLFSALIGLLTAVLVATVYNATITETVAIFAASCAFNVFVFVMYRNCRKLVNFRDGFCS